ncbi:hypothetical protein F1559_003332 [Cyanidiococcus yangmingshanensis]|uniref:Peptidase M16C associated domain-containing protein n=1 Tax=Cyanidiococcus yangmingshanensis TaxID=2690220 RepID=A0A7J7IPC5_9RHOD|nr:hypothetical protein F1559_003332 [Cyanidiococcus yangmingshanensis]
MQRHIAFVCASLWRTGNRVTNKSKLLRHNFRRVDQRGASSRLPCFTLKGMRSAVVMPTPSVRVKLPKREPGDKVSGFVLIKSEFIPEIQSYVRLYKHEEYGTEVVSVVNDDENKTFGVAFRTPPGDSTGVPHILEHSVLCGSRKYPVKEPFVELLKTSMNTFLNAMTFPDKTCYPVASTNLRDFYNLVDVYLDAVFFPRLTPDTLAQEGHHVELDSVDGQMCIKGVVYNEMKGAFSSPERVLMSASQRALFPDTTYGVESGGDPAEIPELTWEAFKGFYDRCYHPGNARIWFYGDDPEDMRLRKVAEFLEDFSQTGDRPRTMDPKTTSVSIQRPFVEPRTVELSYASDESGKFYTTLNWMLHGTVVSQSAEHLLSLVVLDQILLGSSAAPLRKALIDSGLGEDIIGGGLESDLLQMSFSVGMKGIAREQDSKQVAEVVLGTLRKLASEPLPEDLVLASLNTIEFRLRENNTGSFPRGLALMLRAMTTWLHDGDPITMLSFEQPLAMLRKRIESGEPLFQAIIQQELLENAHRVQVILRPDAELAKKTEEIEKSRLETLRQSLSKAELEGLVHETQRLREKQAAPDAPEDIAKVPSLHVSDLDRTVKTVPREEKTSADGVTILSHPLSTNGIVYVDIGFDTTRVPSDLLPLLGIYAESLFEIGTRKEDFVALQRRIGRDTGGVRATVVTTQQVDEFGNGPVIQRLFLRGKATSGQTEALFGILSDVLHEISFTNRDRIRQLIIEERAGLESRLVPSGHLMTANRLKAQYRRSDWLNEQLSGISYLRFLRTLQQRVDHDWDLVMADLERLHRYVLARQNLIVNVTYPDMETVQPHLESFLTGLPARATAATLETESTPAMDMAPLRPINEGLVLPARVNYVGKAANLLDAGVRVHGALLLATRYLSNTYLWEEVRVKGGAYGGFCRLDPRTGTFLFLSYRDPNIEKTVDIYDHASDFLQRAQLSRDEIDKSIIGIIGDMDTYELPDTKGFTSTMRYLTGETDELRQKRRDEIFGTSVEDFRRLGEALAYVRERGSVAVLGAKDAIRRAESHLALERIESAIPTAEP